MTLDPNIPPHLIVGVGAPRDSLVPRATRLHVHDDLRLGSEVWIGGAHTAIGERLEAARLTGSWIVDLAGDLDERLCTACARYIPRVFGDIEAPPPNLPRLLELADELAEMMTAPDVQRPERLYIVCQQGLNRSALMAGRLLRSLGMDAAGAVQAIRTARPGALSNETFLQLLHD